MVQCIIFDLDGTLVDSETLCNQAFIDLIPNLSLKVEDLLLRFRGRKLAGIFNDIESIIGRDLPANFEAMYRARVYALFDTDLVAFPHVQIALQNLDIKMCIASSGPQYKIATALKKTGLYEIFSGHIYSSYDIQKWKPDPSLFLYAASEMGIPPQSCLVIEDSAVGIDAAISAGMRPLQFCDGTHTIEGVESFSNYKDLTKILNLMTKC
jgi:HAD superfamily hydrolase (TIGR01509 family)